MELLERESHLAELHHLLHDAAARHGRILFLGGEAGVGKSSLVEAFLRQVEHDVESVRSSCDALSTPGPLNSVRPHAAALGISFEPHVREGIARDELFHAMLDAIHRKSSPMLMVGEDAHWADDASLDLVRFIGRRIDRLPLLLIITYRDDEVGAFHPLQRVLGDLATAPGCRRLHLLPLSETAVRTLAASSDIDPSRLHQQTGGNPFYVTEILAAGGDALPASVSDAVLARASRLSPNARFVLGTAAILGTTIDLDVLTGMEGLVLDEIEECVSSGLLRADEETLAFRHQLSRDAIYGALIAPRRRMLHGRALTLLRGLPNRDEHLAELAHHAELAGDREATLEFAIAAARQATELRSHREAAQQYARALRVATSLPPAERANLLEVWSHECYLTNEMSDAIEGRQAALRIWRDLGDHLKEGENLRWLSRVNWFAGHNAAAEVAAQEALAALAPLPPGPQLAWAYSNLSQLRVLAYDTDDAIEWGEKAIALAEELSEQEVLIHAEGNVGIARIRKGDSLGYEQLKHSLAMALDAGFAEHAGRAWTGLSSASAMQLKLAESQQYLSDGIDYAIEHDQDSLRLYMTSWRALIRVFLGDWPAAETDCDTVLSQPRAATVSRIVALTALGRLRARRGDPDAFGPLDEALVLAGPTAEMQRLGPVHTAKAEAAWLAGDVARSAEATAALLGLTSLRLNPWLCGEIAWWLRQNGERALPEGELGEPYALLIADNWSEAAAAWDRIGCPYEAGIARLAIDDEDSLRAAHATFEHLGASPAAARAMRRLREIGSSTARRGPDRATRAHPAGLTVREAEILSLVTTGCTNREIADRLYLSNKTVEHHVSSILSKLSVTSRRDAARAAFDLGLDTAPRAHRQSA